jgi:hypothetical protein
MVKPNVHLSIDLPPGCFQLSLFLKSLMVLLDLNKSYSLISIWASEYCQEKFITTDRVAGDSLPVPFAALSSLFASQPQETSRPSRAEQPSPVRFNVCNFS